MMFKMVVGGNGRTVYCGIVRYKDDMQFTLEGTEYDAERKEEFKRVLTLRYDFELSSEEKDFKVGDPLCVTVMPSRKDPDVGVAEEIAGIGKVIAISNDRGNEKYILLGKPKKIKWNNSGSKLTVSFVNLKNLQNMFLGMPSSFTSQKGEEITAYWLNVSFFKKNPNSKFKNNFSAERLEKFVTTNDTVCMVVSKKMVQYNGVWYENYNGAKFMTVGKEVQNSSYSKSYENYQTQPFQNDMYQQAYYESNNYNGASEPYIEDYNRLFNEESQMQSCQPLPFEQYNQPYTQDSYAAQNQVQKQYVYGQDLNTFGGNSQFADFSDMFGGR